MHIQAQLMPEQIERVGGNLGYDKDSYKNGPFARSGSCAPAFFVPRPFDDFIAWKESLTMLAKGGRIQHKGAVN